MRDTETLLTSTYLEMSPQYHSASWREQSDASLMLLGAVGLAGLGGRAVGITKTEENESPNHLANHHLLNQVAVLWAEAQRLALGKQIW